MQRIHNHTHAYTHTCKLSHTYTLTHLHAYTLAHLHTYELIHLHTYTQEGDYEAVGNQLQKRGGGRNTDTHTLAGTQTSRHAYTHLRTQASSAERGRMAADLEKRIRLRV